MTLQAADESIKWRALQQDRIDGLHEEVDHARARIDALESRITGRKQDCSQLRDEQTRLEPQSSEPAMRDELVKLAEITAQHERSIDKANASLAEVRTEMTSLRDKVKDETSESTEGHDMVQDETKGVTAAALSAKAVGEWRAAHAVEIKVATGKAMSVVEECHALQERIKVIELEIEEKTRQSQQAEKRTSHVGERARSDNSPVPISARDTSTSDAKSSEELKETMGRYAASIKELNTTAEALEASIAQLDAQNSLSRTHDLHSCRPYES